MARAGASESLEKAAPKPRVAGQAKAVSKAAEKKPAAEGKTGKPKPRATRAVEENLVPATKTKATTATKAAKAAKAVKATPAKPGAVKGPPAKVGAAKARPAKTGTAKATPTKAAATKAPGRKAAPDSKPTTRKSTPSKATAPKVTAKADSAQVDEERSSTFPAKTLDKLRRLLETERETYWRQAHDLAAEAEALASEREPGDTQFDEESGEGDTLNIERERDLALSASARQAVEEIDRALFRMETGIYGVCERCSKRISVARLEALPFAALCIDCKSREERRR
jgi:RNA polymerase-binding transcription factor DksA